MTETAILVTVALVAFAIGSALGYYLAAGRERRADERAAEAQAELGAYRSSVTEHFKQTAVHFRELGEQYRSLHEHLATGAEALCEVPKDDAKLRFAPLVGLEAPAAADDALEGVTDSGEAAIATEPESEAATAVDEPPSAPVDYALPEEEIRAVEEAAAELAERSDKVDPVMTDPATPAGDVEAAEAESSREASDQGQAVSTPAPEDEPELVVKAEDDDAGEAKGVEAGATRREEDLRDRTIH